MKRINLNNGLDLLTTRSDRSSLYEGKMVCPSVTTQLDTRIWQWFQPRNHQRIRESVDDLQDGGKIVYTQRENEESCGAPLRAGKREPGETEAEVLRSVWGLCRSEIIRRMEHAVRRPNEKLSQTKPLHRQTELNEHAPPHK